LAILAVVREEWLQVGLATRTDWRAVRRIVPVLYSALGLQPPDSVITFDSPREGLIATASAAAVEMPHHLRDAVRRRMRQQVSRAVRAKVRDEVRACIHHEVRQQVRRELRDQIQTRLLSELPHLFFNLGDAAFGLHDAPWLATCDFFSRIGIEGLAAALPWMELARAGAGWWWSFDGVAIVTSAPSVLERDPENRLHCEHGPALAYSDGWAIWAIHGVCVPERLVTNPRSLSVAEIVHEPDLAIRRAMLERLGYERFVRKAGLKPVQADRFGRLYRLDPRWTEPIALVEVLNGTPEPNGSCRRYFLCVPPTVRTAHEAVAWTFQLEPREYRPNVES
jgi:hypothetical protein